MDTLLKLLLDSEGSFLSGEKIAETLGVSRNTVWKRVNQIREMGFEIESYSKKGYRLLSFPKDRIIRELILKDLHYPMEIILYEEIDSTNLEAKRKLNSGGKEQKEDFLLIANHQTHGKGRLDRIWENQKGKDITMTLVLHLDEPLTDFYQYTMIASVALRRVFEKMEIESQIKWPNDIYVGNRKLCGILSEMQSEGGLIRHLIVGIGINVNSHPSLASAVSIADIIGKNSDRNSVIADFLNEWNELRKEKAFGRFGSVYREWKSYLKWLGKRIKMDTGREIVEGILRDVNEKGVVTIEVEMKDEKHRKILEFYSGDLIG